MREKHKEGEGYFIEEDFFIIEEFQSEWNRWMALGSKVYLYGDIDREFTACGQCWQETSVHGTYDEGCARTYCNALNDALEKGEISDDVAKVTRFRICRIQKTVRKTVLEANRY